MSIVRQKSLENILFNQDAAERAALEYCVTSRDIFNGGAYTLLSKIVYISGVTCYCVYHILAMHLKKMGNESLYKKRFLWIDAQNKSFHWSKKPNRVAVHKSVSLIDDVQSMEYKTGPVKYSTMLGAQSKPEPSLCMSLLLHRGECIDIQVRIEIRQPCLSIYILTWFVIGRQHSRGTRVGKSI